MFIHDRFPGDDDGTFIRDQSLKELPDIFSYGQCSGCPNKKKLTNKHRIWLGIDMVACASFAHACCWVKDYFMCARLGD